MNKLKTPLGLIKMYKDDKEIEYTIMKLDNDSIIFPNVEGRYKLTVNYESDNLSHLICCVIDNMDSSKVESGEESGESLECQSFYKGRIKLSIGIECDTCYYNTGEREGNYDYDSKYLENGIGYSILPTTDSHKLVFGIAWINDCTDENDIQTWYAADPTVM